MGCGEVQAPGPAGQRQPESRPLAESRGLAGRLRVSPVFLPGHIAHASLSEEEPSELRLTPLMVHFYNPIVLPKERKTKKKSEFTVSARKGVGPMPHRQGF